MFNKKNNEIVFFCDESFEGAIPEPQLNYRNIPEWFARTPKIKRSKCPFAFLENNQVTKNVNIKGCPGISDFLTYGYTIPAWTNFFVRNINDEFCINWQNSFATKCEFHSRSQFEGMSDSQNPMFGGFIKITSPWYIKTSPGISCLITHPHWLRENRFTSVSGIMHTDAYPIHMHWFFEWKYPMDPDHINYEVQTIKEGTPLTYILPFRREKISSKINYLSPSKMSSIDNQFCKINDWFDDGKYNRFRKKIGRLFS